jgi:hypothetical protein
MQVCSLKPKTNAEKARMPFSDLPLGKRCPAPFIEFWDMLKVGGTSLTGAPHNER